MRADVDDVNEMNDATDAVEQPLGSLRRREFLTKAAATGAIVWATPMILSRPAHAQEGGGGTPECQPEIRLTCVTHDCGQGNKCFPGVRIEILDTTCPCSTGTVTACVLITGLTPGIVAYGDQATCDPPAAPNEVLSTGDWECIDMDETVFFGRPRSGGGNGAIPELSDGTVITFTMAVWAGGCTDTSGDPAFECRTVDVSMVWQQDESDPQVPDCGRANPCTIEDAAVSACDDLVDPGDSPCECP